MSKYYVYELWNPVKDEPFYVGKGSGVRPQHHLTEAQNHTERNKHKANIIRKLWREGKEPEIKIVFETDNEIQAFKHEEKLIKKYGRRDLKTGCLTNLTNGGEGVRGFKYTPELREIRRNAANELIDFYETAIHTYEQIQTYNADPTYCKNCNNMLSYTYRNREKCLECIRLTKEGRIKVRSKNIETRQEYLSIAAESEEPDIKDAVQKIINLVKLHHTENIEEIVEKANKSRMVSSNASEKRLPYYKTTRYIEARKKWEMKKEDKKKSKNNNKL